MTNINTCPQCGGNADNGFDRCDPPTPYVCTKCEGDIMTSLQEAERLEDYFNAGKNKPPVTRGYLLLVGDGYYPTGGNDIHGVYQTEYEAKQAVLNRIGGIDNFYVNEEGDIRIKYSKEFTSPWFEIIDLTLHEVNGGSQSKWDYRALREIDAILSTRFYADGTNAGLSPGLVRALKLICEQWLPREEVFPPYASSNSICDAVKKFFKWRVKDND